MSAVRMKKAVSSGSTAAPRSKRDKNRKKFFEVRLVYLFTYVVHLPQNCMNVLFLFVNCGK